MCHDLSGLTLSLRLNSQRVAQWKLARLKSASENAHVNVHLSNSPLGVAMIF